MEEQPSDNATTTPESTVLSDIEIIYYIDEPEPDPSKRGNKPKQLKALEVKGFEVGRGLRKRIVNPDDVYKLAAIGATDREIAAWFDVQINTLNYTFADIIEKGRQELRQTLRKAQLNLALKGNATMLIWLGKNILGQSDLPLETEANQPLPWTDDDAAE